jgi:hypothetical protein
VLAPTVLRSTARSGTRPTGSEIHGIVTSSQVGISPFPDVYAGFFSLLLARGSFFALARSETHI